MVLTRYVVKICEIRTLYARILAHFAIFAMYVFELFECLKITCDLHICLLFSTWTRCQYEHIHCVLH